MPQFMQIENRFVYKEVTTCMNFKLTVVLDALSVYLVWQRVNLPRLIVNFLKTQSKVGRYTTIETTFIGFKKPIKSMD